MNPIYQSMTGEIQCTMVGPTLFVREWIDGKPTEQWRTLTTSPGVTVTPEEALAEETAASESSQKKPRNKGLARTTSRWGCIYHCLTSARPSIWYVEPESERLTRQIERLMRLRDEAHAAEEAERPDFLGVTQ